MEKVKLEEEMSKVYGAIPITLIDEYSLMFGFRPFECPYSAITKLGIVKCTNKMCNSTFCVFNADCKFKEDLKRNVPQELKEKFKSALKTYLPSHGKTVEKLYEFAEGRQELIRLSYSPYLYGSTHSAIRTTCLDIINRNITANHPEILEQHISKCEKDYDTDTTEMKKLLKSQDELVKKPKKDIGLNQQAKDAYDKLMAPVVEGKPVKQTIKITLHEPTNLDVSKITKAIECVIDLVTTNKFDIEVET